MTIKQLNLIDQFICQIDSGIRAVFTTAKQQRANPAAQTESSQLSAQEKKHSAALMRINHVGEVCAQALYAGQAITARTLDVRNAMQEAANEEVDHLSWCEQRLAQLNSHTSYLNPLWYAGAFTIGVAAGIAGDRWSLGFVAETERQVVKHLEGHLKSLPQEDKQSRVIIEQMRDDELKHATTAMAAGAAYLPQPVTVVMKMMSKVMTTVAYWC